MRVYAISDVHTDYRDNLQLLTRVARYPDDALILAGDVSDRLSILRQTFSVLLERFRYVFYVPGNHEMWIRGGEYEDSLQKFHGILELCA
jgi:3',5'-cyclic AMP phosphodiesterase CpdA